jgi:hypothetical protein
MENTSFLFCACLKRTKPYELGSINTQLTMLLSVVFIAIFGKSYIVYFSVPAIPTHCRRQVDTLLLPGNHAENIITMEVYGTTVVMLMAKLV